MHEWKRISSEKISTWFRRHRPKYCAASGMQGTFWQAKYYPFGIDTQEKLREKVDDKHKHPVDRGLVERAVDDPWSSARY